MPNSACGKDCKVPCEDSASNKDDSQSRSQQAEGPGLCGTVAGANICSCAQSPDIAAKLCIECNALHGASSSLLTECSALSHYTVSPDLPNKTIEGLTAEFSQAGTTRCDTAASLCDDASWSPKPIPYHHCCDLAQLDPRVLCLTCGVFHSGSCREKDFCRKNHKFKPLGVCLCGKTCKRQPLVLCRYCGREYCRLCWYRNPLTCTCGQTFDQSPV